jgi:hypothetical protein
MMNKILKSERGDSTVMSIGILIGLLIIILLIWKMGIPVFKNMQLAQFAEKQVNYDWQNMKLDATMIRSMHDQTYNKAKSLDLPVSERDMKVEQEAEKATIEINYKYPVDLFLFKFNLEFHVLKITRDLE